MDVTNLDDLQTREYWEQRYANEGDNATYDWFKNFSTLESILTPYLPSKDARILELGCGNSDLAPSLYAAGYTNVTSLDFSATLIRQMTARFPDVNWVEMDIRELVERADELGGPNSWDVVIDKGTLDALVAEKGSVWDPSDRVRENARKEMDGVLHLLKPGARFIYLTWLSAPLRMFFLERPGWTVTVTTVNNGHGSGGLDYYLYVATKHAG